MYYLGKYGSDASRREYDRIIAEFVANGRRTHRNPDEIRIDALIAQYLNYIEKEVDFSRSRKASIIRILRRLNTLYGAQPVTSFGSTALKAFRQRLIDEDLGMNSINTYIATIKQVFSWGCEEELVPVDIAGALKMVKQLQEGRTSAKVYAPVERVSDVVVEATVPHLKLCYQDMIKVQRRISGRPQDVLNMRYCDIDRTGDVWVYMPYTHKTKKRGKARILHIGPKAQQILAPYFEKCNEDPTRHLFTNRKGEPHKVNAYGAAVKLACVKAGVEPWSPNQLRHAGGTEIRAKYGLETAKIVLGHTDTKTTEIYAKTTDEKAIQVAREIG